jgi:hypothetical protein
VDARAYNRVKRAQGQFGSSLVKGSDKFKLAAHNAGRIDIPIMFGMKRKMFSFFSVTACRVDLMWPFVMDPFCRVCRVVIADRGAPRMVSYFIQVCV